MKEVILFCAIKALITYCLSIHVSTVSEWAGKKSSDLDKSSFDRSFMRGQGRA